MNVVDSSAWLSYLLDEPNAERFSEPILNSAELVVPSIVVLEVYRHIRRWIDLETAAQATAAMSGGLSVDVTPELAILAAELGLQHRIPLADSVVLATARSFSATLWTQDSDFEGLENVNYLPGG